MSIEAEIVGVKVPSLLLKVKFWSESINISKGNWSLDFKSNVWEEPVVFKDCWYIGVGITVCVVLLHKIYPFASAGFIKADIVKSSFGLKLYISLWGAVTDDVILTLLLKDKEGTLHLVLCSSSLNRIFL